VAGVDGGLGPIFPVAAFAQTMALCEVDPLMADLRDAMLLLEGKYAALPAAEWLPELWVFGLGEGEFKIGCSNELSDWLIEQSLERGDLNLGLEHMSTAIDNEDPSLMFHINTIKDIFAECGPTEIYGFALASPQHTYLDTTPDAPPTNIIVVNAVFRDGLRWATGRVVGHPTAGYWMYNHESLNGSLNGNHIRLLGKLTVATTGAVIPIAESIVT